MSDEEGMRLALQEAARAQEKGEVPVGAVLVCEGSVIASAHNLVETGCDASLHAEMLCLKEGARVLGNWRLTGATLYCTLEPCPMCAGAMILSRLTTLVWGAPDLRHGAHGSWMNLLDVPHPIHHLEVRKGVLEGECAEQMRLFFREVRRCKNFLKP